MSSINTSTTTGRTPKTFSLKQLADILGLRLLGDGEIQINGIASLDEAQASDVSFIVAKRYQDKLVSCQAGALICEPEMASLFSGNKLLTESPYLAYARLSKLFSRYSEGCAQQGVHSSACIAESAVIPASVKVGANVVIGERVRLGDNSYIGPGSVIGDDVAVGDDAYLHANVNIYHGVKLGHRVMIHSGAVIGSDGFGFAPLEDGWQKIYQLGSVQIGNDVEIGANTTIDRGALDDTLIEDGVIIDNLVHIAHNVKIGRNSAIAAQVGIAGSTEVGEGCTFGGACGVIGHIELHPGSHFNGATTVLSSTSSPGLYASTVPHMEAKVWRKNMARLAQLDKHVRRIADLEKQVKTLQKSS